MQPIDLSHIEKEVVEHVFATADKLYAEKGSEKFPTVHQVRKVARTDMNATLDIMQEWRRRKTMQPVAVVIEIPEVVSQAYQAAAATAWQQAQELGNENLRSAQAAWEVERAELDELRREVAVAFDEQAIELEQVKAAATQAAQDHQAAAEKAARELDAIRAELERVKAQAQADRDLAKKLEGERNQAQRDKEEARERAAMLEGRLEQGEKQNADLLSRLAEKKGA